MTDTTLTVRLPQAIDRQLDDLSKSTKRSKAVLAEEAITHFVRFEAEIVAGIKRGIEDAAAGRVVPHDAAMERIRATIANPRQASR